ncbi:MAG TPA: glycosyl hydrolase, partial [Patescibacteria group bacterium]|nr:glycosyl hydrolase [Patescibacteria group bacterium]
MRLRGIVLFGTLLILGSSIAIAQPWINDSLQNFYEVQRAAQEYWKDRPIEKGQGWKQFKRWEWFWEQRVAPSGEFPNPMQLLMERPVLKDKGSKIEKTLGTSSTNPWTFIGQSESEGGYFGLGRINSVITNPGNANIIWVGSGSGGAWKSTNGGTSWTCYTDALPTLGVGDIAIDPTNTNVIYLATGDGNASSAYSVGVLKSTDGGETWNTTGLNYTTTQGRVMSRILINPSNSSIVLVATNNGIFRTTNGGTSWTQVQAGNFKDMEFKPGDPSVIYAGTSNGGVFRSSNSGSSFSQITSGLPTTNGGRIEIAVSPAEPEIAYALFASSTTNGFLGLYISYNSGLTWSLASNSPNILDGSVTGNTNSGQGWYDLALAVSPVDAAEVFVGGLNVWRSQDAGSTWTRLTHWYDLGNNSPTIHADQHCLYFAPGTSRLFAANDGGLYTSTNSGNSWSWIGNGLRITQFYRLGTSASSSSKYIFGAQDNSTKYYNGSSWMEIATGDGMESAIDPSNENIVYTSSYYGALQRSLNGGSSFASIRPTQSNGSWITPYMLNPQNPSTIFAGYTNVWKSLNRGSTWTQISSFSGSSTLNVLQVAPSDSNTIYVSTGSTSIRRTMNGGGTWTTLNLPVSNTLTYLAIHPNNPQHIWATFSGYSAGNKVFVSTNGGSSWANISGSLSNIPVNCIVYQNNSPNRIYVGTDVGVYYLDSTISDWEDYNQSLPNVIINELEIQYSSGKLRAATYGRGAWEANIVTTSINVGSVPAQVCQGGALSLPISSSGLLNSGNTYTAQLSSSTGDFTSPIPIGSLTATGSGTI